MNFILEVFAYLLLIVSRSLFSKTDIALPKPDVSHNVVNTSEIIGWPANKTPRAPKGFIVNQLADGFKNARTVYETPHGELLVAESKAGRVTLLRDENNDGYFEKKLNVLKNLNRPFGILVLNNWLYIACVDSLMRFPYEKDLSRLNQLAGKKILDLPSGGNHWTRNIIADKSGKKFYIAVGSSSNIAENGIDKEENRAAILEANIDGSDLKVFASGLRNPVGLGWAPGTNDLWTTVNERDLLGEDLVPDYFTKVKRNGFYGWPYTYFGEHLDPRIPMKDQRPDLVKKSIVPDIKLTAHSAPLGFAFYENNKFPSEYRDGAFIAQHGSWNRKVLSGYKVIFVPFHKGTPAGPPRDFLTGFIANEKKSEVYGRPVGVTVLKNGTLLITDDGANIIWKITYQN